MRTTLDLEVEVLQAVKEISAARGIAAGQVVSELLRKALTTTQPESTRNGLPLFSRKAGAPPLTMAMVNSLREG